MGRSLLRLATSVVLAFASYMAVVGGAAFLGRALPHTQLGAMLMTFAVYLSPHLVGGFIFFLALIVVYFVVLTKKGVFAGAGAKSRSDTRDV